MKFWRRWSSPIIAIALVGLVWLLFLPNQFRAARLFSVNCAGCHLRENRDQGSPFSDLMDGYWQWGGSLAQIDQSIRDGRNALMPPWLDSLSEDGVREVAEYVAGLVAGNDQDHPGKIQFDAFCVACHGVDAAGNPVLGAPDLTDGVWLYGSSIEAITESIRDGRQGVMPGFADRLDDAQIRLLGNFLTR